MKTVKCKKLIFYKLKPAEEVRKYFFRKLYVWNVVAFSFHSAVFTEDNGQFESAELVYW